MSKHENSVFSSVVWRFLERCGAQGVTLVVSIVLARLLDPGVYGVVAIVTAFTSIFQTFIDSGLGNALIQKKNADNIDFSTVFYFNVVICLIMYAILWIAAPFIASFYQIPELTSIVRVMGLMIVVSAVKNIQHAYVAKHMMFKKFFYATLAGTIGAALVGVSLAYRGYGVWALVIQQLFNTCVDTLVLWFVSKWRPTRDFSFARLKGLFSYGWKLVVSDLIDKVYGELRQLIIGKQYSTDDTAFFTKGRLFPNMIITNINSSINSVLLPVMSEHQDNLTEVKNLTKRAIKVSTYIIYPMMVGMAVCGEQIVRIVLTDKWLPCVSYLRLFCISYMLYPIHTANLNAIKAVGRSDLILKLEIAKKIVGFAVLFATAWFGPFYICLGVLIDSLLAMVINTFSSRKTIQYGLKEQMIDIFPQTALCLVMGTVVYAISYLNLSDMLILILQVSVGAAVYVAGSVIFKLDSFRYLLSLLKSYLPQKRKA